MDPPGEAEMRCGGDFVERSQGHFLGAQRFFNVATLGDIHNRAEVARELMIAAQQGRNPHHHPLDRLVRGTVAAFEIQVTAVGDRLLPQKQDAIAIFGMHPLLPAMLDRSPVLEAQDRSPIVVHKQPLALGIGFKNAHGSRQGEHSEPLFAGPQLHFGGVAFGNVLEHGQDTDHIATAVELGHQTHLQPTHRSLGGPQQL